MTGEIREVRFPAMAFAMGILVFPRELHSAFVTGILVIWAATAAALIKSILENHMPLVYARICMWVGTGALAACAFELGFYALGMERSGLQMIMQGVVGTLAAEEIYQRKEEADYDTLFWECAVVWALWIGVCLVPLFADALQKPVFAFLAAGTVLELACLLLHKTCLGIQGLYMLIPAVLYRLPLEIAAGGEILSLLVSSAVTLVFLYSVCRHLRGTLRRRTLEGLPSQLISMGIVYMVLSVY